MKPIAVKSGMGLGFRTFTRSVQLDGTAEIVVIVRDNKGTEVSRKTVELDRNADWKRHDLQIAKDAMSGAATVEVVISTAPGSTGNLYVDDLDIYQSAK
ncbi:MAG: hypothetical protein WCL39_08380, partial [Armatimonadota bacterium]